jgi:acetyl-CoA acyltransferase
MMTSAVIAGYVRSPFTPATKGALARVRPDDLVAQVVKALIARAGIPVNDVEDLIVGCAFPEGEQGFNVARLTVFIAGLPVAIGGATVNRLCGSSMEAVHMAVGAIQRGAGEAFICAGVESMTRIPMTGYNPMPNPGLHAKYPQAYMSMGLTAENLAKRFQITRDAQQAFAVESHAKAAQAQTKGRYADEIVPIAAKDATVDRDGGIRPDTNQEVLSTLAPAFDKDGTITAGTSSPLTDGASATLICSEDYAKRHGLKVLARIRATAVAGCAPEVMGIGPVAATKKVLARAGLELKDIDIVEMNEAFAAQVLACVRELGIDRGRLNLDGGAIALGHPLGASGARITGKAASLLKREGKRYALATLCVGGGQGMATILEAA